MRRTCMSNLSITGTVFHLVMCYSGYVGSNPTGKVYFALKISSFKVCILIDLEEVEGKIPETLKGCPQ